MPCSAHKPFLTDRGQESLDRPVIQVLRRFDRHKPEIDRDRVPLVGPNPQTVRGEREPPFVVRLNNLVQLLSGNRLAVLQAGS